jgi:sodium-dependent dicarboxylate transporter 2/3/5
LDHSYFLPNSEYIHDCVVAMFMALLLFIIPSKNKKGEFLINWQDAEKLPFDIILMFGGGFAMAKGFEQSGLTLFIGNQLKNFQAIDFFLLLGLILIVITIVSEFASNVACIQLMLPILFAISTSLNLNPLKILIPATLAASFGFMLPIATAPNTIVFGAKRIQFKDMIKVGLLLDIIAVFLVLIYSQLFY